MSKSERVGALIVIGLFCILGALLYFTVDRPTGASRGIENNVIIEQRLKINRSRNP